MSEAKEHFKNKWGTGFYKATLQEKHGILQLSMIDVYDTMESYHQSQLSKLLERYDEDFLNKIDPVMNNPRLSKDEINWMIEGAKSILQELKSATTKQ